MPQFFPPSSSPVQQRPIAVAIGLPVTALLLAALSACGGGGGGAPEATASAQSVTSNATSSSTGNQGANVESISNPDAGTVATPAPAVEPLASASELEAIAMPEAVAASVAVSTFDAGTVTSGWQHPAGLLASNGSEADWIFQSQKLLSWWPGGVSAATDEEGKRIAVLQFDFGCANTAVTLRTKDCRNVVVMYQKAAPNLSADGNSAISLEVRNTDSSASMAVRITDSTGQTLQYPFMTRSVETPGSNEWTRVYVPIKHPTVYWNGSNDGIPHGKISVVSVVASPLNSDSPTLGLNYPAGKLEVRSVQIHNNFNYNYKLETNNAVAPGAFYPTYTNRLAIAHNKFDPVVLAKAKAVGFGIMRKDIFWEGVEIHGTWDFSYYSQGLTTLANLGMKALWILDYVHPDHGGTPPTTTAQLDAFSKFAVNVAKVGKGKNIFAYEIWNEPDQAGAWPTPSPTAYATLLSQTVDSIRSIDTTAPIVSGGIAVDEPSYLYKLAKTGVLSKVNAIGIHPYRKDTQLVTSPTYRRNANSPEGLAGDQAIYKNVLGASGVTKPLWNTEWGYPTVDYLDRAVYGDGNSPLAAWRQGVLVSRMVLTQLAMNSPLITVYNLVDKGTDPNNMQHHFGLLTPDLKEKPAYVGLKTLYAFAGTRAFKGYLSDVTPGLHALRWDGPADRTFALWVDNPSHSITVTLPARTTKVIRWDGAKVTPIVGADGSLTVNLYETVGPLYVQVQ